MKITTTKEIELFNIGDIVLVLSNKCRRRGTRVSIGEVNILHCTELRISAEAEQALLKLGKSDLFTDGVRFYTTFGNCIRQIKHPLFDLALLKHRAQHGEINIK